MTQQIHGHDVMAMMLASKAVYTRATLHAAIIGKFGAAARFHTCSAENMDATAMIEFLAQRGKLTEAAGGFSLDPTQVCRH